MKDQNIAAVVSNAQHASDAIQKILSLGAVFSPPEMGRSAAVFFMFKAMSASIVLAAAGLESKNRIDAVAHGDSGLSDDSITMACLVLRRMALAQNDAWRRNSNAEFLSVPVNIAITDAAVDFETMMGRKWSGLEEVLGVK